MSKRTDVSVLHVDDDPGVREITAEMLKREDERLRIETASSASDGLDYLADYEFDCIVSDYEMPDMNGIEFLQSVREDHPNLPFILFTGKGSEEVASEAISAGVTDYLQKKSGTGQYTVLAHRIDNALSQYDAERRAKETTRQLKEQNEILSALIDALPAGILAEDASREVLAVNQQYLDLWELSGSPENLVGRSTERIVDDLSEGVVDPEEFVARTQQLITDDQPVTDEDIDFADGRTLSRTHRTIELPDGHGYLWIYRDITDRKERTRRLERQQEQIEMILDRANLILWEVNLEDNTVSRRGPVERVFGVPSPEIPTKDSFMETVVHPADREVVTEMFRQIEDGTREIDEITFRTRMETDAARWVWVTAYLDENKQDDDPRVVGLARDITDFAKLDKTTGGEDWYQTLLNHSIDIIAVIDQKGMMQYKNPAMAYHLGYEPSEIVDENALEYVHPDDVPAVQEAIEPVMEGDQFRSDPYEYRFRHADGSWRWFESVLTDCTETPVDGYLVNSRNISERKTHQQTIENREKTLRRAYEIITDKDRSVSEKIDALLEVGRDFVGTDYATFSHIDGDQYEFEAVAVAPDIDLEAGDTTALTELPICERVFRSGHSLVLDDVATEAPDLVDPTWGIACYLGAPVTVDDKAYGTFCFYDVEPRTDGFTDWETTFVELLTDWVSSELTRQRTADRLHRQNKRLDEFVSVVSHDLQNPLKVANARLELAREECDSDHLTDVDVVLGRMETLIKDLRTLARHGEPVSEIEPVALTNIAEECWQTVATTNASLVVETDIAVRADRNRLKQLLENLIRNAVEHGGKDVTVTIGECTDGLYVADDGPGIPDGQSIDVFEKGYSTTEKGTGFGLAIVQEIVDAHGWEIHVTDSVDGGARFEITHVDIAAE